MATIILNRALAIVFAFALLLTAGVAYAEEDTGTTSVEANASVEGSVEVKPERPDFRSDIRDRVDNLRDAAGQKRDEFQENRDERKETFEQKRTDAAENRDARKDEFEEKRDERKDQVLENVQERIEKHLDRFARLLEAAIDRVEGFISRISERADLLADEGVDVSEARAFLDTAQSELAEAESDLERILADYDATFTVDVELTSELIRDQLSDTKAAIASAKSHIRAAFSAVRDAFEALKRAAQAHAEVNASVEADLEN